MNLAIRGISGNIELGNSYKDVPGFCKSASLEGIAKNGYVLTPGRYVGVAPKEEDAEPFPHCIDIKKWHNKAQICCSIKDPKSPH